jgi:hypothetical protein
MAETSTVGGGGSSGLGKGLFWTDDPDLASVGELEH